MLTSMDLDRALAFSRYARRVLAARPEWQDWLVQRVDASFPWQEATPGLDATRADADARALDAVLRELRAKVMLHTIARDMTRRAPLEEVVGAVTQLAEFSIRAATALHHAILIKTFGEPIGDESGAPQHLCVVGMGKLGGGELNVSSDVDLVFVYGEEGETRGPRKLSNREFFERLGRRLIQSLHEVTAQGFVFRVDMRLRPYGDAGPLAVSHAALEQYLITQGRTWERYAWLKARALTGDGAALDALVTPFVYRKYLDYDAYAGLRDVHRQIREQGARRDYARDIKLGEGGIRELEFVVQALQIVRGGRDPSLRVRGTLPALGALAGRGVLPESAVASLRAAYRVLRDVEHRLQYRDDQQTQALPENRDELAALAEAMGAKTTETFVHDLGRVRQDVTAHFAMVLGDTTADATASPLREVWEDPQSESAKASLVEAGYDAPGDLLARLRAVQSSARYLQLPAQSRQRFDTLVPRLLDAASRARTEGSDAAAIFQRLLDLLEAVSRRSAYLALLIEHPPLMPRLANLMAASAWAAAYLTRHPILLDELLDTRFLFAESDWSAWRVELAASLDAAGDDQERQMDELRHFQHAQTFRLLVQDLAGALTVERLADHLSALADIVLEATLPCVWRHLNGGDAAPRFAVIGYGKLGGKELGYASDLDLVFLYDVDETQAQAEVLPARYARFAQRLNTWLTSTTGAGQLYETDLRLRPDGASGLNVSSVAAFKRYQREKAWTWEHQALTRARFVAGDAAIGDAFEAERDAILRLPRDHAALANDVVEMRRRMYAGHQNPTAQFDLKHDEGGMVDIEFAVQFIVLAHAHRHPGLTRNAGNIALLGLAAELALIPQALANEVADAYRAYRRQQHAVRLTGAQLARVDPAPHAANRASVDALWALTFGARWRPADVGSPGRIG